jgi:elongation factor P--beta-lysine ligase
MSDGTHLIIAEVKRNRPQGKVSDEQKNMLDVFASHIPHTYLWREDDLDEVIQILMRQSVFESLTAESLWIHRRREY